MKTLIYIIPALLLATACAKSSNGASQEALTEQIQTATDATPADPETDEHVMSPDQEDIYLKAQSENILQGKAAHQFRFAQTTWKECVDVVTGNYLGSKCSNSRAMSEILKKFMDTHMYKCVDRGLAAEGGGSTADFHIVHAGVFADPRHSPKSMHSENRAIDIRSIEVKLKSGGTKKFIYEGTTHRAFYKAFRQCWGEIVQQNNKCPLYKGTAALTATIGWENKDHQHHMHTSVPYCINGKYSPLYYQK